MSPPAVVFVIVDGTLRSQRPSIDEITVYATKRVSKRLTALWIDKDSRTLVQSVSVYLVANALRLGIPFLLLPFLTAYLTLAEYGVLALFQALVQFVLPLTPMNVDAAVSIAYFRCQRQQLPSYLSTALLAPLGTTALLVALLAATAKFVSGATEIPVWWVVAIPAFGLVQLLPNVVLQLYQARRQPLAYAGFSLGLATLNIVLSLLGVVVFGWGWPGRMYGIFLSYLVFSAAGLAVLYRFGYLSRLIRRRHFVDVVRFSLFLVPHSLGGSLMALADRFLLSAMVGVEAVGAYAVGFQIGSALLLVGTSVNQGWAPHLFRRLGTISPRGRVLLVRQSYLIAGVLVLAFAAFLAVMPLIFGHLVSESFAGSRRYAVWIALASLFNGFYVLVGNYIFYEKKTYILSGLTLSSALVNVGLNYWWIGKWGTIGAAYASAASSFLFFLLAWLLAQHVHPMPWLAALRPRRFAGADSSCFPRSHSA